MCLLFVAHEAHPDYSLILAANRDEYFERPSLPVHPWHADTSILAGKDVQAGGTWFGVSRTGRWGAVTNYRETRNDGTARSRGTLVTGYLEGDLSPGQYVDQIRPVCGHFNGFNLLLGNRDQVVYFSNRSPEPRVLEPGVHGLSNHLLNTPWPKVAAGRRGMSALVTNKHPSSDDLFLLLGNCDVAADENLPETGITLERERLLSSAFIKGDSYGTRSSTVLLINRNNRLKLEERNFDEAPDLAPLTYSSVSYEFDIDP